MKFPIERSTLGLWLAIPLLILVGTAAAFSLRNSREADTQVRRTHEIILAIERVRSRLQDAETGQRGYLLTQREAYRGYGFRFSVKSRLLYLEATGFTENRAHYHREPYDTAQQCIYAEQTHLLSLIQADPTQKSHYDRLESLIHDKMNELRQTIDLREAGKLPEAMGIILSNRGKDLMDSTRDVLDAMQAEEQQHRIERSARSRTAVNTAFAFIVGGSSLLFILVLASAFAIQREMQQRLEIQEALRQSEQNLGVTLQSIGDALLATDREGRVTMMNPVAEKLTGWTETEAKGKHSREVFRIVNETSRETVLSPVEEAIRENRIVELANHTILIAKNGQETYIDDSGAPIRDASGNVTGAILVFRDITIRKQARIALENLNVRLRRAMSETHHRVKNNLQVISALVEIQAMEAGETVPTSALIRVGQHVKALATIHDLLTTEAKEQGDVEYLATGEVLEKLRPLLESVVGERRIHFTVEDVKLPIRQGTSLAVLVNELVSNAVKHGEGDIDLSLAVVAGRGRLTVRDNGPGFPPDFTPKAAANTGLELIDSLGRWDLGGELDFRNHPEGGACVVVCLPAQHRPGKRSAGLAEQDNVPSGSKLKRQRPEQSRRWRFEVTFDPPWKGKQMTTQHRKLDTRPAFLFDLDGTLVDSVYQHVLAWREALEDTGIELAVWTIHRRIGMSGGLLLNALLRETGQPVTLEQADRLRRLHAEAYARYLPQVRPLPGARELLAYLTEAGVPWAIATSGLIESARPALDMLGIGPEVTVITRDQVQHAKPDPDLFLAAAERLGVDIGNSVVVGDSVWDLLAARRARALGIGLLSGGYGQEELAQAGAYRVYQDPVDMLKHLDEVGVRVALSS